MNKFPLRTCIACRIIKPQSELIRLTLDVKNQVVTDKEQKFGKRGVYVCDKKCLKKAIEENLFSRAFRKRVTVSDLLKESKAF